MSKKFEIKLIKPFAGVHQIDAPLQVPGEDARGGDEQDPSLPQGFHRSRKTTSRTGDHFYLTDIFLNGHFFIKLADRFNRYSGDLNTGNI